MIWFASLTFVTGLVLVYVIVGRPYLKTVPGLRKFFAWIEPIEIKLWGKSETLLWARYRQVLGYLIVILALIGQFDPTPFYTIVPYKYQWLIPFVPLAISASGGLAEYLRRNTTKPVELVAVPDAGLTPQADKAMAAAEASKDKAVAAVEKAEAPRD